jgi:hypothetical protein
VLAAALAARQIRPFIQRSDNWLMINTAGYVHLQYNFPHPHVLQWCAAAAWTKTHRQQFEAIHYALLNMGSDSWLALDEKQVITGEPINLDDLDDEQFCKDDWKALAHQFLNNPDSDNPSEEFDLDVSAAICYNS